MVHEQHRTPERIPDISHAAQHLPHIPSRVFVGTGRRPVKGVQNDNIGLIPSSLGSRNPASCPTGAVGEQLGLSRPECESSQSAAVQPSGSHGCPQPVCQAAATLPCCVGNAEPSADRKRSPRKRSPRDSVQSQV